MVFSIQHTIQSLQCFRTVDLLLYCMEKMSLLLKPLFDTFEIVLKMPMHSQTRSLPSFFYFVACATFC